ncbi:hypothetical protein EON80_05920 [bacterium]|nr:MAG: hypothetical protein EON80_05920 [bacterium]
MKNRPDSVTVVACILIATGIVGGLSPMGLTAPHVPVSAPGVARSIPFFLPLPQLIPLLGVAISILSAIYMLRGENWARLLYIYGFGPCLLVALVTSPVKTLAILEIIKYSAFVIILLSPQVSDYFLQPAVSWKRYGRGQGNKLSSG